MAGFLAGAFLTPQGYAENVNKKMAQTGMQFLSVVSDAKGAGMAEAMTSLEFGSSSLFFNPAGMANMKTRVDASMSLNQWIADIEHNTFSLALSPARGEYGVVGFSFQYVDYGTFIGTRVEKGTDLAYTDTDVFTLSAWAAGVGYAKRLTDRFSVGGHVRWIHQNLGESVVPDILTPSDTTERKVSNTQTPMAFDFGTQFKTGIKSLVFGMSVRNFSKQVKYVEEGFQLPLVFNLGISMNVMDLIGKTPFDQSLVVSIDASHHRDHPEQLKFGLEYTALGMLSLRGGYVSNNDEDGISFGMGISRYGLTVDYTVTPFGVFTEVQRMTVRFSL